MAFFGPDKYRYTLHAGALSLSRSVYISALHKTDRRDMAEERVFLVHAFFRAVQNEAAIPPSLMGGITNQINRFAIAVFEEGSFLHLSEPLRKVLTDCLLKIDEFRTKKRWDKCMAFQEKVVRLTTTVHRGRLGSVIARHVHDKRAGAPECVNAGMSVENLKRAEASREFVLHAVQRHMPVAMPLLRKGCKYGECKEMRRILYMNAVVAFLVTDDVKRSVPDGTLPPIPEKEPTMQALLDIGVVDCHVKGKQNVAAWDEFLTLGCRVANETPLRIFERTYADLEANYVAGKKTDLHSKPTLAPKRKAEVVNAPTPKAPRGEPRDIDLFATEKGDAILGFKNATTCGRLIQSVPPLVQGQRVFVKIGERGTDCDFSVQCYRWTRQLGMPSVDAVTTSAHFTFDWWKSHAVATDPSAAKTWAPAMLKKMGKATVGPVPVFMSSEFVGQRLQYVADGDERLRTDAFGETLTKVLLFSKRVGAKDLGAFNMLIDAEGHVLQVDMNRADASQILKYNAKGLQTSHKLDARFWDRAKAYTVAHPREVAAFLRRLVEVVPLASGVVSDLFSDTMMATLDSAHPGGVEAFVNAW